MRYLPSQLVEEQQFKGQIPADAITALWPSSTMPSGQRADMIFAAPVTCDATKALREDCPTHCIMRTLRALDTCTAQRPVPQVPGSMSSTCADMQYAAPACMSRIWMWACPHAGQTLATALEVCRFPSSYSIEKIRDRKSTRLNSSHSGESRMPSSA